MATFRYDVPGSQNDFKGNPKENEFLQEWSDIIQGIFDGKFEDLKEILGQEPLFFSEINRQLDNSQPPVPVSWNGFPRNIQLFVNFDRAQQFQAAERRGQTIVGFTDSTLSPSKSIRQPFRQQDEYLEWVPIRKGGVVEKYAFTAEGPEYWEFLAESDRNKVLALYKEFTGRNVDWSEISWDKDVWDDLGRGNGPELVYKNGAYNPYNSVNVEECAAHLTHPANTLSAEIDLAAKATVQRSDTRGNLVSERRRLACCSNFGDPNRNSDPEIGRQVNLTVRGGVPLTLANPVGLYIQRFDSNRVADKNGNPIPDWWKIIRGSDGRILRAEFGPPESSLLTLDDVRIGSSNEPLTSGGQLAELISVVLYARILSMRLPEPGALRCNNRCCVKKGNNPDRSLLKQVRVNKPCFDPVRDRDSDFCKNDGCVNAFPELGAPQPLSPFERRLIGRGRTE